MSRFSGLRSRRLGGMSLVAIIVFLPALAVAGTIGADRLGYCVNDILPGEQGLNTNPYVQNVQTDSATIVWRSNQASTGVITWGEGDTFSHEQSLPERNLQVVQLQDLEPSTTYQYRVEWGTERERSGTFATAPLPDQPVSIGVIGDSGTGSSAQWEIAAQLEVQAPDIVLHTGDVVYRRGAICHYGPKYFSPYESLIASVPVYPTLGNHDLMASDGKAYFDTFALPASSSDWPEHFYTFTYGPAQVFVVNSEFYDEGNQDAIDDQRKWLQSELGKSESKWKIVMLHRPPFSSTDNKQNIEIRDDLAPIFEQGSVALVLSGHAHNYERTLPLNGVTYVVSGGGGADLYGLDPIPESAASAKEHHLVRLDVTTDTLTITAIDRGGETIDSHLLNQA